MKFTTTTKKILFFWSLFHLFGYCSFLTGLTPSFKSEESNGDLSNIYLFTPEYSDKEIQNIDIHGHSELKKNMLFPDCSSCDYNEKDNFWPFHRFTYSVYSNSETSGFVGVWGYYGHYEFIFYMVFPFIILVGIWIYRKFINDKKEASADEIESKIEDIKNKIELLDKSYDQGLLTEQEYKVKKEKLEINRNNLAQIINDQTSRKQIFDNNKESFARLIDLKESGLINSNEYEIKLEQLQSEFLTNSKENDFSTKDNEEAKLEDNKKNKIWLSILIIILFVFFCLLVIEYLHSLPFFVFLF